MLANQTEKVAQGTDGEEERLVQPAVADGLVEIWRRKVLVEHKETRLVWVEGSFTCTHYYFYSLLLPLQGRPRPRGTVSCIQMAYLTLWPYTYLPRAEQARPFIAEAVGQQENHPWRSPLEDSDFGSARSSLRNTDPAPELPSWFHCHLLLVKHADVISLLLPCPAWYSTIHSWVF
jgi:hypothetical protein